jgi:ABC-2 type transport system permease protein
MGIVQSIAKKECKESWLNGSLKVFTLVVFIFFIVSILLGAMEYKQAAKEKKDAATTVRQQWLEQGVKNPHGAGHYGMLTFRPVEPLNILEKGMNAYFGQWIYLETHNRNDAEKKQIKDLTTLARFGDFTPAFLFQFIAPLLIILLSYASVSREREQNTLCLLLSQQVSNFQFIMGKCLGNVYKILLVFLPLFLCSCIVVFYLAQHQHYPVLAHFTMCLFYLFYLLIFLFISIIVSILSKSSKQSLLLLFVIWIGTCAFIPRFSSSLSEKINPAPSSFDLKTNYEIRQGNKYVYGYKGFGSFATMYSSIEKRLMREYHVSTPDSLPVNVFGFVIEETEEEGQRLFEKSYGSINTIFQKQNEIHRMTAIASPLAAIRFLSMGLSHSDMEEQINFTEQSENYRRRLMKTLNMDIAYHSKIKKYNVNKRAGNARYERGEDLWSSIPDFTYMPLSLGRIIRNHVPDLLILMAWLSFTFLVLCLISRHLKLS